MRGVDLEVVGRRKRRPSPGDLAQSVVDTLGRRVQIGGQAAGIEITIQDRG